MLEQVMSGKVMVGQARSGYIRLYPVSSGYDIVCQFRLCQVFRLGQVMSGYVKLRKVRSDEIILGQVMSG
jgi:hypothetical protein